MESTGPEGSREQETLEGCGTQWHNPIWDLSQAGQSASIPGQVCRTDGWLLGVTHGMREAARRCEGSHGSLEHEEPLVDPVPPALCSACLDTVPTASPPSQRRSRGQEVINAP